jgi:TctA family transporter
MSRGSFDILLTRPLATAFIGVALAVMVLPAVLPSARAAVRMVARETAE